MGLASSLATGPKSEEKVLQIRKFLAYFFLGPKVNYSRVYLTLIMYSYVSR